MVLFNLGAGGVVLVVALTVILTVVNGNSEGDALYAFRHSLTDPDNVLDSWDPTLVNPCTWFHITCNQDNHVTRLYVFFTTLPPLPFFIKNSYMCMLFFICLI